MSSKVMSVSEMRQFAAYEEACDAGFDPKQRVAAETESYYQLRQAIEPDLRGQAQEGAAELADLFSETQARAQHTAAPTQVKHVGASTADLRMIEAQAAKTLIASTELLQQREAVLRGARQHVVALTQTVEKKKTEYHRLSGFTQEMGRRVVDYVEEKSNSQQ